MLIVGTANNKNVERAFESLKGINCVLDIVGPLSQDQINILKKNEMEYIGGCNVTDKEMVEKYEQCDIVLFPSIYEGFGMIIIEGQQVGRPVVTSNIEPMLSVAGGGACILGEFI